MTTTTERNVRAERRTPPPDALPPLDFDYPAPIAEELERAYAAGNERDQAEAEARAAHAAIDQATIADRSADKAAVAAGKPLPKLRAADKARAAASAADRRSEACEANYRERFDALTAAIVEHRPEWERQLHAEIEAQEAEAIEALNTYQRSFSRITLARRALDGLTEFRPGARRPWSGVSFGENPREAQRRERKRTRALQAIDNRGRIGLDSSDVDQTLLALELIARDYKPGAP